jgi:hypothetical protein
VDGRPAAGDVVAERPDRHQRAAHVDGHLHDIGPDDRGHASLERVEQRERGDDRDREHVARADGDAHHDADGEDADAFGCCPCEQKQPGGDLVAETLVDELVGGQHLAAKVARQEEHRNHDAAEHVSDHDLQKAEVAGEGDAGHGDDGEGGGFGRDDGERDGPPGDGVVGQEIALERAVLRDALALAEAEPEERDGDEIGRDDR